MSATLREILWKNKAEGPPSSAPLPDEELSGEKHFEEAASFIDRNLDKDT